MFDKPTLEELEREKAELSKKSGLIHAENFAITFVPKKRELDKQAEEVDTKLGHIKSEIDAITEEEALPKVAHLYKENRGIIKVMINNSRIQVAENLDVVVPFSGCTHTLKMSAYELLRFQSTMSRNTALLEAWQMALREGSTITKSILCPQCLKEKKKQLEKGFNTPSKRTGSADVTITVFK
jgi:hypothetical protein